MTHVFGDDRTIGALPEGDEKRREVEDMFDRVAPSYDRMKRIISLGLDRGWRRKTVAALDLPAGSRVLDLACGTGDLCNELLAHDLVPVGVDFSAGMLASAHTSAPLVRADGAALPLPDACVDGLVCGFALRNFVDLKVVFAECGRVLRSGGRFAALDATVPTHPLMQAGNAVWFRGVVPVLGRLVGHDGAAYSYLPRSPSYLPPHDELARRLERADFYDVRVQTFTGGSVLLMTGTSA